MKPSRPIAVVVCLVALVAAAADLGALEVQSGRVRLVLHEGSGRYSLYALSPGDQKTFVPLFVDRDPRTSGLSLVVDGRISRLGEGGVFRESVEKTADGARFLWEAKTLRVTQTFTFVTADGAVTASAVRVEISITNLGYSAVSVGVRDCLDTYLGENKSAHFRTEPGGEVSSESTVPSERMIRSWVSAGKDQDGVALRRVTSGPGVTLPDRIVFANWKRLNEVSWFYDTSIGRSFNLLPYSINDSAVCQYYEPQPVAPGSSRRIVSILGIYGVGGLEALAQTPGSTGTPSPKEADSPDGTAGSGARSGTSIAGLGSAVQTLNDLLLKIDGILSSGQPLSAEEIQLIEQALSDIKSRSEPYLQNQ